jgi:hypothetical protein
MGKVKEKDTTYRPTVRYDKVFQEYVDSLYQTTNLDRNQILRLALFVLGHTSEGLTILEEFQKEKDVPTPLPSWELFDDWELWLGRVVNGGAGGENVRRKLEKKLKPKKSVKIHSLSYTIINRVEGDIEVGELEE